MTSGLIGVHCRVRLGAERGLVLGSPWDEASRAPVSHNIWQMASTHGYIDHNGLGFQDSLSACGLLLPGQTTSLSVSLAASGAKYPGTSQRACCLPESYAVTLLPVHSSCPGSLSIAGASPGYIGAPEPATLELACWCCHFTLGGEAQTDRWQTQR